MTPEDFACLPEIRILNTTERLIALLWWRNHRDAGVFVSFEQLRQELENAGYTAINKTREKEKLAKSPSTVRDSTGNAFRLNARVLHELDGVYGQFLEDKPVRKSNSLLQRSDFTGTRGYIEKVVLQINSSYDNSLFDCCTVMVRRLLETLIIETYEARGRDGELKGADGNFMMFSGLLTHLENDTKLNVGRTTKNGLKSFKKLADNSAHNRRFNAIKKHIDDLKQDIQLAVAELLQLAFNKP